MINEEAKKEDFGNWYTKIDESNNLLDAAMGKLDFFLVGTSSEDKEETARQADITQAMLESVINKNKSFAIQIDQLVSKLITLF